MPDPVQVNEVENLNFEWGKKRGVGGKKKEIQFYESFIFDGVEYSLYDSVYAYKEGEPEPYISKVIKIWEQPDKTRKVKLLWFFRPSEILNFLGDVEPRENELFLASGEGAGLANINQLETISGKCNVICTSKDTRNPQPPAEVIQKADYIFYRTFDVAHRKISDKIDEKIAGVEVKCLFNKAEFPDSVGPKQDSEEDTTEKLPLSNEKKPNEEKPLTADAAADVKPSLVKQKSLTGVKRTSDAVDMELRDGLDGVKRSKVDSVKDESKLVGKQKVEEREKGRDSSVLGVLNDRPLKKPKVDKLSEDKNMDIVRRLNDDPDRKNSKALPTKTASKDGLDIEKNSSKNQRPDEKVTKLSNGRPDEGRKIEVVPTEVSRRPEDDKSSWFKELPWEGRMQSAHQQGTLVLLQNLDPAYTSAEVEDIIWHGFQESCSAKITPQTLNSNPHSGQALVIFKTTEAAVKAVKKLEIGCFMLPNGRPLIGSIATLPNTEKQSTLPGHLAIDKIKLVNPRDMKLAVATSHCSQPNTIEYEMAMEWCLLHARGDMSWKKLYKQQGEQLKKLKASLKSK